jgi:hypothetical protein
MSVPTGTIEIFDLGLLPDCGLLLEQHLPLRELRS